ncbi:MAG: hypothetical protein ACJAZO_002702 [Myxococcota bacterium]|jgi:hypothetical protein
MAYSALADGMSTTVKGVTNISVELAVAHAVPTPSDIASNPTAEADRDALGTLTADAAPSSVTRTCHADAGRAPTRRGR